MRELQSLGMDFRVMDIDNKEVDLTQLDQIDIHNVHNPRSIEEVEEESKDVEETVEEKEEPKGIDELLAILKSDNSGKDENNNE